MKKHLSLAGFWFSLSFQQAALLTILIPATVNRLTNSGHIVVLAQLVTLGDFVAMLTLPLIGALSDRIRAGGGRRRGMIVVGSLVNLIGLCMGGSSNNVPMFAIGFLLAILGISAAGAAFQAIMPEVISAGEWGKASGYMGVASLLGNALGLALTGFLPTWLAYILMMVITVAGAAYTYFGVSEPKITEKLLQNARPKPRPAAFYWVFAARFLVMFGQTLLMTFVLDYFRDVLHVARPTSSTAELSLLALVGAAVSSLLIGNFSDRYNRARIVAVATLPMAGAVIAFGFTSSPAWTLGFAVLYGLGYGAFLSVDWALALDTMPSLENIARNLGIWGIAATLPSVISPAVGGVMLLRKDLDIAYQHLFWLAGATIFAGALVVWIAGGVSEDGILSMVLSVLVASILSFAVFVFCRPRFVGRIPSKKSVLVVSNHVHDFDGAFVPPRLYLSGNLRHPVYSVASQRLFEPGFLANRAPRFLRGILRGFNVGSILRQIGVRPIEDTPRIRPLASWTSEIRRQYGDLPLKEVVAADHLRKFEGYNPTPDLRISQLYRSNQLEIAEQPVSLRVLREPYQSNLRSQLTEQILKQINDIVQLLKQERTVFVTPEGRLTRDGFVGSFRSIVYPLLQEAEQVFLSCIAYNPLRPGRLGVVCRVTPHFKKWDLSLSIAALRPVTASQVLAHALGSFEAAFTEKQVVDKAIASVQALPRLVFVEPDLLDKPKQIFSRVFKHLVKIHYILADPVVNSQSRTTRYVLVKPWKDKRFSQVVDMFQYLQNQWTETISALSTLAGQIDEKSDVNINYELR